MLNKPLKLGEIEAICRKFELDWQESSLESIREFAEIHVDPRSVSFPELLLDLLLADLQLRWTLRSDKIEAQSRRGEDPANLSVSLPPSRLDYLAVFQSKELPSHGAQLLAQTELDIRWRHGDIPDWEGYKAEFPGIKRPKVGIPKVRIFSLGKILFETELFGNLLIGRQGKGEPIPPALVPGTPRKLVCCGMLETTTSRNQLELQACSKSMISISNRSSNRTLLLGGSRKLPPGVTFCVSIHEPVQIPLKEVVIIVERA